MSTWTPQRIARGLQRRLPGLATLVDRLERIDRKLEDLEAMTRFALGQISRVEARQRQWLRDNPTALDAGAATATRESFDFQWRELPLAADEPAITGGGSANEAVCAHTGRSADWFAGKRVLDVGCGGGRFSRAFLELGAEVVACDQSAAALESTRALCAAHTERLTTRQENLLEWSEPAAFDLVYCFGVVHHTGNTYRALDNVLAKVAPGGLLFLMVYGSPVTAADCRELNSYEAMRDELVGKGLEERKAILQARYDAVTAHGVFDAVSPPINDLMSMEELRRFLSGHGFVDIRRTVDNRNLHVVARRRD